MLSTRVRKKERPIYYIWYWLFLLFMAGSHIGLLFERTCLWLVASLGYSEPAVTLLSAAFRTLVPVYATWQEGKQKEMQFSFRACFVWVGVEIHPPHNLLLTLSPSFLEATTSAIRQPHPTSFSRVKNDKKLTQAKFLCMTARSNTYR